MTNPLFDHPILNSPYECPRRHWELDGHGQPTQQIIETRRRADFVTLIPKASSGNTEESQGSWDPKTRTLTWKVPENAAGGITITTSTYTEDGKETWSILAKDGNGETLADVSGKSTRRKE
jgi:hypothetical protein